MPKFDYHGKQIYYSETGAGAPLVLLHGNTACGKMFFPIIPAFSGDYRVIVPDFLGNGQSERIAPWPSDLWYGWGEQVEALCEHLSLPSVFVIGSSGGALAALSFALEHPNRVRALICDSFEGLAADPAVTQTLAEGRTYAKQMEGFRDLLRMTHGDDWETVFDADTDAVLRHAAEVGRFFHHPVSKLKAPLLLTGSAEDEMFPRGQYEKLFSEIRESVPHAEQHIFAHGSHPAMLSNPAEFAALAKRFFGSLKIS